MTEEARKACNAYQRKWRSEHREKVAKYNSDYWTKKAKEAAKQEEGAAEK